MRTTIKHLLHDKNLLIASIVILIIGLGAGYGIRGLASPSHGGNFPSGANGAMGNFSARGGAAQGANKSGNGGLLTGTVASKDSSSITIDTKDGNSRIVLVTPSTGVSKSATGSLDDIAVGSTIFVSGTTNSDGSVSASLIQLRPAMPSATVGQ